MKYIVTESQVKTLQDQIQGLIDSTLDTLKEESDEWGMGEMDELDEVSSVENIVVNNVVSDLSAGPNYSRSCFHTESLYWEHRNLNH